MCFFFIKELNDGCIASFIECVLTFLLSQNDDVTVSEWPNRRISIEERTGLTRPKSIVAPYICGSGFADRFAHNSPYSLEAGSGSLLSVGSRVGAGTLGIGAGVGAGGNSG